jgi:hypothetical protein
MTDVRRKMPSKAGPVDHPCRPGNGRPRLGRARQLSTEHDLTAYDAAYLELALRRHSPLASCDQALIEAGRKTGLEVLGD